MFYQLMVTIYGRAPGEFLVFYQLMVTIWTSTWSVPSVLPVDGYNIWTSAWRVPSVLPVDGYRPCLGLYPVSTACLQLQIDTGKQYPLHSKSQISKLTSVCSEWVSFHMDEHLESS